MATLSLAGAALATLMATGCSSAGLNTSTGTSPGTTTSGGASPSIPCGQITALRTALTNLTHTRISVGHAPAIVSDLATIKTQVESLSSQSGGAFSAQARSLQSGLTAVETAARHVLTHPSPASVQTMTLAVEHLKATAGPLLAEMQSVCPSPGTS